MNLVSRYVELFMQIGCVLGALILVISYGTLRHQAILTCLQVQVGIIEGLLFSSIERIYAINRGFLSEVVFEAVVEILSTNAGRVTSINVRSSARIARFGGGSVHGAVEEVVDNSFLLSPLLLGEAVVDLLHRHLLVLGVVRLGNLDALVQQVLGGARPCLRLRLPQCLT